MRSPRTQRVDWLIAYLLTQQGSVRAIAEHSKGLKTVALKALELSFMQIEAFASSMRVDTLNLNEMLPKNI